jgi:general secretion pathway protein L
MSLVSGLSQRADWLSRWLPAGAELHLLRLWRDGLLSCLPPALRRRLAPEQTRMYLMPEANTANLVLTKGEQFEPAGECPQQDVDCVHAALSRYASAKPQLWIKLPKDAVLTRTAAFPAQVKQNLKQVIGYEIDRLTPFRSDQVFYDFRIQRSGSPGPNLIVEIAVSPQDRVQFWASLLRESGMRLYGVDWEGAWEQANLLPVAQRPKPARARMWAARLLALFVVFLAAAVLISPLAQKREAAILLEKQADDLRFQAGRVTQLRTKLDQTRQSAELVLAEKQSYASIVELLKDLTDHIPDNTWIQNLDYDKGEVQLRGESTQATALIGLLEEMPGIDEVRFRSPVVQIAAKGKERFHISFRYTEPQAR